MKELVQAIVEEAERRLDAYKESAERTATMAKETVEQAKKELSILEETAKVGASQSFLGASLMLVGCSEYPINRNSMSGELAIRIHDSRIELHGDPQALKDLKGRYKAIVLLYKAD